MSWDEYSRRCNFWYPVCSSIEVDLAAVTLTLLLAVFLLREGQLTSRLRVILLPRDLEPGFFVSAFPYSLEQIFPIGDCSTLAGLARRVYQ